VPRRQSRPTQPSAAIAKLAELSAGLRKAAAGFRLPGTDLRADWSQPEPSNASTTTSPLPPFARGDACVHALGAPDFALRALHAGSRSQTLDFVCSRAECHARGGAYRSRNYRRAA